MKFIVDANVGKLTKWLRLLGHDTVFFDGKKDAEMIAQALDEERTILTRDTHIMKWGIVSKGRVRALLVEADEPQLQVRQVVRELKLEMPDHAFTVCLECNERLKAVEREDIRRRVPPYVLVTQQDFLECPKCHRVYWKGTHWRAMVEKVRRLSADTQA